MKTLLLCFSLLGSLTARGESLATPDFHHGLLSASAAPVGPAAVIHREIDKLVALYTDGFAYNTAKMRHIAFGSLFDTERQDAVAFFSLGGVDNSNVDFEYVAIFAQGQGRDMSHVKGPKERPFHLVTTAMVGNRGTRTLTWETAKIRQGQIVVQGMRWAEGDAGCCPTKPIEVTFNISAKLVDELTPDQYPILRESEAPGKPAPNKSPRAGRKAGDK